MSAKFPDYFDMLPEERRDKALALREKLENMSQEERTREVYLMLYNGMRDFIDTGLIPCFTMAWKEFNLQGKGNHVHSFSFHVGVAKAADLEAIGDLPGACEDLSRIMLDVAETATAALPEVQRQVELWKKAVAEINRENETYLAMQKKEGQGEIN